MNFNYPLARDIPSNPSHIEDISCGFEVGDAITLGHRKPIRDSLDVGHPLERVEKNRFAKELQLNMNMLRNVQGIHAPLRIQMELKAFDNVGRLPFLPSSNLSKDVLLGRDDQIDFSDILHPPEVHEKVVRPHIYMDRNMKIL